MFKTFWSGFVEKGPTWKGLPGIFPNPGRPFRPSVGMTLGQNSAPPQLGGRGTEGPKA